MAVKEGTSVAGRGADDRGRVRATGAVSVGDAAGETGAAAEDVLIGAGDGDDGEPSVTAGIADDGAAGLIGFFSTS
jgi:hypothetical protein